MVEAMVPEPLWKASYRIPEGNLDGLRARLLALNKKALKLGVPPVLLTETGRADEPYTVENAWGERITHYRTWVTVDLEGVAPKLAGWSFVATLDHASEAGVILRTVPGETLPAAYREALPTCDHCRTVRKRHETFVVRHETGLLKHVGRDCLADFLGHKDPHALAAWASLLGAFATVASGAEEEGFFGGGYASTKFGVSYFTTVTVAMVERWGWLSRSKARETDGWATADRVVGWLYAKTEKGREHFKLTLTDAHAAEAAKVIEWARGLRAARGADLSDYEHNLVVVMEGEALDAKNAGIAASAVTAYRRAMEREVERRERAAGEALSEHFGTIGKRATFTLTVLACIETEGGMYGPTFIYKFRDAAGNRATWFSSRFLGDLTTGSTWRIKATVKAHEVYKGSKHTILTRGAIEEAA
jgi:hypothetical protein